MALSAPTYSIGDVVYLRESAALGFLEAYSVEQVYYSTAGVVYYKLRTTYNLPNVSMPVGDQMTGHKLLPLNLPQSALTDRCTALTLAQTNLETQLATIQTELDAAGCEDATG